MKPTSSKGNEASTPKPLAQSSDSAQARPSVIVSALQVNPSAQMQTVTHQVTNISDFPKQHFPQAMQDTACAPSSISDGKGGQILQSCVLTDSCHRHSTTTEQNDKISDKT